MVWHNRAMRRVASRIPRIYVSGPLTRGATATLAPVASHHLLHVLRARTGDPLIAFDGAGAEFSATIAGAHRGVVTVKLGAGGAVSRESPLCATLVQAVSAAERMDYTLQKAVELGVSRLQPITSERSVVRLDQERAAKRQAHWEQIVIGACEQCGRTVLPEVRGLVSFADWVAKLAKPASELRIMLSPRGAQRLTALTRPAQVMLLAGPEGGFAPHEVEAAVAYGFIEVRLGPRVLRTETAALTALAAMQLLWGDF